MEISGFIVKHSKNKSRKRKSTETILQNHINALFKRAEAEPNKEDYGIQDKRCNSKE